MNIGILTYYHTKPSWEEKALLKAAKKQGHHARIFSVDECSYELSSDLSNGSSNSSVKFFFRGKKFPSCDALMIRPSVIHNAESSCILVKVFEESGVFVVNRYESILAAKNKLRTLQILTASSLSVPRTVVLHSLRSFDHSIDHIGGFPVIVKTPFGTVGSGVLLAESRRSLFSILHLLWKNYAIHIALLQEFIQEAQGSDIRVFVVFGKIVAAMIRSAGHRHEFRSNIGLGGTATSVQLTREEKDLAIRAAKALQLDIAGVDLIRSSRGPLILEVNANPGFEGLQKIASVNIADEIIKSLYQQVRTLRLPRRL